MPKTATLHVRLDENIKNEALMVFDSLGINLSDAITLYLRQVALKNRIPFDLSADRVPRNNFERVHSIRRDNLDRLLKILPGSVDELWVFGSSVTEWCRPDSDLDVLVIGDSISSEELNRMYRAPGCAVDLLNATKEEFELLRNEEGSVYQEAYTKGLLIYKKGVGLVA